MFVYKPSCIHHLLKKTEEFTSGLGLSGIIACVGRRICAGISGADSDAAGAVGMYLAAVNDNVGGAGDNPAA